MRAILYDCSDHPNALYRGVTLRLIDDDGRMVMQGKVLTNDGRDLAQRIAAGLGAELTCVGPPKSEPAKMDGGKTDEPQTKRDLDGLRRLIAAQFPQCEVLSEVDVGRGPELLVVSQDNERMVANEDQLRMWFGPRLKSPVQKQSPGIGMNKQLSLLQD